MSSCVTRPDGSTERTNYTDDVHIDTLNKHLANNKLRAIVSPVRMWSNASSYSVQFDVARGEVEQTAQRDADERAKCDDDVSTSD